MAKQRLLAPGILAAVLLVATPGIQCNRSNCEDLRDELHAQKLGWQSCEQHEDCIIVGGNTADCTGIMSCNFAVNRQYRHAADRRVASLPEETADCFECASPNCIRGEITLCEPVSGRCIIVTEILDDGSSQAAAEPPSSTGGQASQSPAEGQAGAE